MRAPEYQGSSTVGHQTSKGLQHPSPLTGLLSHHDVLPSHMVPLRLYQNSSLSSNFPESFPHNVHLFSDDDLTFYSTVEEGKEGKLHPVLLTKNINLRAHSPLFPSFSVIMLEERSCSDWRDFFPPEIWKPSSLAFSKTQPLPLSLLHTLCNQCLPLYWAITIGYNMF